MDEGNAPAGISVTGVGHASLPADIAILKVTATTTGWTVEDARQDSEEAIVEVWDVLEEQGIQEEDVSTTLHTIQTREAEENGDDNGEDEDDDNVDKRYEIQHQLTVKHRDFGTIGILIEELTNVDRQLSVEGIEFALEDDKALEKQARWAATDDAKEKASQLAQLLDVTLGPPVSIKEVAGQQTDRSPKPQLHGERKGQSRRHRAGLVHSSVTIHAVFTIQDQ